MLRKLKQFATAALLALLALAPSSPPDANIVVQSGAKYISASVASDLDMDADYAARATAAGVLYSTNFEDVYTNATIQPSRRITTQVELADESISISDGSWAGGHTEALQHITRETAIKLSGSASLRFNTVSTDTAAGGSWAFRPNGTDATVYRHLYTQLAVYYPRDTIAYCYETSSTPQLKVINFGQAGNGQLVLSNFRMVGFPSGFINQSDGMIASNTGNEFGTPNAFSHTLQHLQDAIDAGGSTTTQTDMLTRYGPLTGSGVSNGMDTDCTTGSKYLYAKTQPAGFPDTRAAAHGIPFYNDDWTVIEVYLDFVAGDASSVQMWAARYGEQPTLIISDLGNLPLGLSSGGNANSWSRFELLNYDTTRDAEVGRPTLHTYYGEVTVSELPIQFPGGFNLPGAQDDPPEESPAWTHDIAIGKWAQIAGDAPTSPFTSTSSLTSVNPDADNSESYNGNPGGGTNTHQPSVTQSWSGAAVIRNAGTYGKYAISNGGHHNYFGNEVYALDLETLTWSLFTQPYNGAISFPISGSCGWWPAQGIQVNGSPSVPHTYDLIESDGDSFYSFRAQTNESPAFDYCVGKLPFSTGVWEKKAQSTNSIGSGGWSVRDTTRNVFVMRGGGGASVSTRTVQYDYVNNTHTLFNPSGGNISQTDSVAAYDPVDDLIVVINGSTKALYSTPAGSLGTNPTLLTESGAPTKSDQAGFEWSSELGAFLYYSQGDDVYQVKNVAGTWTWTNITDAANTVTPPDLLENAVAVYSKFRIVEYPDGTSVAIVVKRNNAAYAFRISALTPEPTLHYFTESEDLALAA